MFFIDSQYDLDARFPLPGNYDNRLAAKESRIYGPVQINAKTIGNERMLLLALKAHGEPVDLRFLDQSYRGTRGGPRLESPLQLLLDDSLFTKGSVRGVSREVESFAARLVSWRVVKPENIPKK
jgi:hypothetical protein